MFELSTAASEVEALSPISDRDKTKDELLDEIAILRQRVAELEQILSDRSSSGSSKNNDAELQRIIDERTAALKEANDQLVAEVTERHQAESALRAAKDQLQAVLDAVPGNVSWISSDLRYLGVNRHLAETFGVPPEAFCGEDIGFLHSSLEFKDFVRRFFDSPAQDASREVETLVNGITRHFLVAVQKYDRGRAAFAIGIDVSDRHQALEALRHAESKYRSIFENAVEGIFQTTPDGYYLSANPALSRIYGYDSPEELVANLTSIQQQLYVNPNRRSEFVQRLLDEGEVRGFESQIYRKDGSLIWISENARAVRDTHGNLLYYEGTVEDITERKQVEETLQRINEQLETRVEERTAALKELNRRLVIEIAERQRAEAALRTSEAELRALFAAMTDVITVFDAQGRYLKMVATNSELLYKPDVERVGKTVYDILPLKQANLFLSHIQQALKAGKTVSLEYSLPVSKPVTPENGGLNADAEDALPHRWFSAHVSPLPDNSIIWVARDITHRIEAEEALRRAEEKYRSIFENAAEGIFQTTPNGRHISANPALVRMYGYSSAEDLATYITDIEHQLYVDPKRRSEFIAALEDKDVVTNFESQVYRKDGSIIWTSENARAVRDEKGNLLYYEGTVEDITKRKLAEEALRQSEAKERERSQQLAQTLQELQQTQAHLVQSEKMSSLGQLVAGVAHEINNPVNFIYGNLAYANRYTQDLLQSLKVYQRATPQLEPALQEEITGIDLDFITTDLPKLMTSMRVGAERIRGIVRSLQNFSRLDEAELKLVDIHEGVDSTLMILQHRIKAEAKRPAIEIIKHYNELPPVKCYAGQLNQVFMNILSNAIDALETEFQEQTRSLENDPEKTHILFKPQITIQTEAIAPNRVLVSIADNGPGMPEHIRQRVFDPFFTTKEVGKGTGLGMSISHQIVVERHSGRIQCLSEMGKGTQFLIELPIQR
jgi:PAS domain S-box-containing protein